MKIKKTVTALCTLPAALLCGVIVGDAMLLTGGREQRVRSHSGNAHGDGDGQNGNTQDHGGQNGVSFADVIVALLHRNPPDEMMKQECCGRIPPLRRDHQPAKE